MEEFLKELDIVLEKYQDETVDITGFEKDFNELVHKHRETEGVTDIAEVIGHNYVCHKYNKPKALISNMKQWERYNKEEEKC